MSTNAAIAGARQLGAALRDKDYPVVGLIMVATRNPVWRDIRENLDGITAVRCLLEGWWTRDEDIAKGSTVAFGCCIFTSDND